MAESYPEAGWRVQLPLLTTALKDLDTRFLAGKRSLLLGKRPQSDRADHLLPRAEADGESAATTVFFVVGMDDRN